MDPVYLPPQLFSIDPPAPFVLGTDFDWDGVAGTVQRMPGSAIPEGEPILVLQQVELTAALVERVAAGLVAPLLMRPLRILAVVDWEGAGTTVLDWSDLVWRAEVDESLASTPRVAVLEGPPALHEAVGAHRGAVVQCAVELAEDLWLPWFEGFVDGVEEVANDDGQVRVRVSLVDALRWLAPPLAPRVTRRWGREIIRETVIVQTEVSPGFTIEQVEERIIDVRIPTAHGILREIFAALESPYFTTLSLGFLDFPVPEFDGRELTPLQVFGELARLAGATVRVEGRLLLVREIGPASRSGRAAFIYPAAALESLDINDNLTEAWSAIQLFGHSENGAMPSAATVPAIPDPSQPGYLRIGETSGTFAPLEPIRSDSRPPDVHITFTFNADLWEPESLLVEGASRIGPPSFFNENGIDFAVIDLAI
ncbi:MAG: hypothetical protein ABI743_14910, partial [bacterium]